MSSTDLHAGAFGISSQILDITDQKLYQLIPSSALARRTTSWLDVRHSWMTSLRRWEEQINVRDAIPHGRGHAGVDTISDAKIDKKSSESSMLRPHPRLRQLKHR